MKKFLLVAPYFPPRRRVGALRPFKFVIHLKEYGWNPHVIMLKSDGNLTLKEKKLLRDVKVYHLDPPIDRTKRSGSELKKNNNFSNSHKSIIADWIDKHFPVDTWWPFWWLKYSEIKNIVDEVNPRAIWSTGDPWSAHWVGKKITGYKENIFWIADFRDPWTLSETNLKHRSNLALKIDRKLEENWIRKASVLSFTTQSTRRLYEENYRHLNLQTTTIYNAFDRTLFNNSFSRETTLRIDKDKLNLFFFGQFRRLSPAKSVVDILKKLRDIAPTTIDDLAIHCFGAPSSSDQEYISEHSLGHCFVIQDPVPLEQGQQVLKQADLLLLSTGIQRTDIIPAKLWDYLIADRPIFSIAPNPEIREILHQTGTGIQIAPSDLERAANLLKESVLSKKRGDKLPISFSPDSESIDSYSVKSATKKLTTILDEHTG